MAFRRRRRFNGQWFQGAGPQYNSVDIDPSGAITQETTNILYADNPDSGAQGLPGSNVPGGLALAQGQSFLIKRIVGTIFVAQHQHYNNWDGGAGNDYPPNAEVNCGLFVERVDASGTPQNLSAWSINDRAGDKKRWLWRRTWYLSDKFWENLATPHAGDGSNIYDFPTTNTEYGDMRSGPHVDCKAKARVSFEERLFFYIETVAPITIAEGGTGHIEYFHNLRVFGKMTQYGNR